MVTRIVNGVTEVLTAEEEAALRAEWAATNSTFEAEKADRKFKEERRKGYGSVEDQLDMQYWDQVNSTTTWVDRVADVKSKHPKP